MGFKENLAGLSDSYWLYRRDGLHLNGEGAALLGSGECFELGIAGEGLENYLTARDCPKV